MPDLRVARPVRPGRPDRPDGEPLASGGPAVLPGRRLAGLRPAGSVLAEAEGVGSLVTPAGRPEPGGRRLAADGSRRGRPPSAPTSPPPLPSYSSGDRALAVLRPDWSPRGDLVAIDHRQPGDETLIEVSARGRTWLGPSWTSGEATGKSTPSRPTHWTSSPFVDGFEWGFKSGRKQVTRCAVLLRGRSMAMLGQQDDGRADSAEIRLDLGAGVEASPRSRVRGPSCSRPRARPADSSADPAGAPQPQQAHRSRVDRHRGAASGHPPGC